jgi:hypothetical protein
VIYSVSGATFVVGGVSFVIGSLIFATVESLSRRIELPLTFNPKQLQPPFNRTETEPTVREVHLKQAVETAVLRNNVGTMDVQ